MSLVCMVCCDSLFGVKNAEVEVVSGTCGHMLHKSCLQNWFRSEDTKVIQVARDTGRFSKGPHRACPTCRKEVDGAGFFRIYPSFEDCPPGEGTPDEISQSALREKCEDLGKVVCFLEKENEKLKQEVLIGKYTRPIGEEKSSCSNCRKKKGKSRSDKYPSATVTLSGKQLLQLQSTNGNSSSSSPSSSNPFRMSSISGSSSNSSGHTSRMTYPPPQIQIYNPRPPSFVSSSTTSTTPSTTTASATENTNGAMNCNIWAYPPAWPRSTRPPCFPPLAPMVGGISAQSSLYRPYAEGSRNAASASGSAAPAASATSRYPQSQSQAQPMTPTNNLAHSSSRSNPFIHQQTQQYVNQILTPPTTPNYRSTPPYPIYKQYQLQQYPDPYIYNSHNPFLPSPPSTSSTTSSASTPTTSSYSNQGQGQVQNPEIPVPLARSRPDLTDEDINRGGFDFDSIAEFALESSSS